MRIHSKTKHIIKLPIALHIYASMILVSIVTVVIIYTSNVFIFNNYIEHECNKRIQNTFTSCKNFATAFRTNINSNEFESNDDIRQYLLESIASATDLSNESSIALFSYNSDELVILWPNANYNASNYGTAYSLLNEIIAERGIIASNRTYSANYNDSKYYYRLINVEYSESEDENPSLYEQYYMLIYIDSSSYYSFMSEVNFSLFNSMMLSILISSIISLLIAFPLFHSSHKLSKFANRISRGDFKPFNNTVVSREFYDLAETMNIMAAKLQQTDVEQKTFFQNASHEMRTPLMSIQGYAEGIKYDIFTEEKRDEAIDIIIDETNRLSNLVENLLSISKMDMSKRGNYEIKKQKIDVREIVELTISRVRGSFLLQNIDLINNINIDEQFIYANENDVFRMFENIFSNCLRYANKAVVFKVDMNNDNARFVIEDDGPGISPEVMPHLFERFAKGNEGKHGIGLSLAKAIIEEHKGTIEVHNKENGGAQFIIEIPTVKAINQLTSINNNKEN